MAASQDSSGGPRIAPDPVTAARILGEIVGDLQGFSDYADEPPLNIFSTVAPNPGLLKALVPLLDFVDNGTLAIRQRELVILRTGYRHRCSYEWAHHAHIAGQVGLSEDDIARVALGPTAQGWTIEDATTLEAVDELYTGSTISGRTWNELSEFYSDSQKLELIGLAALYTMIAWVANASMMDIDAWLDSPAPLPS